MVGRIDTGIDVLDRKLDGGLHRDVSSRTPPSRPASPNSSSTNSRPHAEPSTSTERSDDAVRHAIESSPSSVGSPTVRHVTSDTPIEEATRLIGALPDGANLIIDTMDVLEQRDTEEYVDFLNELKATMLETGSIALFALSQGRRRTGEPIADRPRRRRRLRSRTMIAGNELENHLTIPKFRGGSQPTEAIKLELTEEGRDRHQPRYRVKNRRRSLFRSGSIVTTATIVATETIHTLSV